MGAIAKKNLMRWCFMHLFNGSLYLVPSTKLTTFFFKWLTFIFVFQKNDSCIVSSTHTKTSTKIFIFELLDDEATCCGVEKFVTPAVPIALSIRPKHRFFARNNTKENDDQ